MSEPICIIIDSREQRPYCFPDLPVTVAGLKVGDYSLVGFEDRISIERKSLNDLLFSLTKGRERFQRELERGRALDYFALIVEATMSDITGGCYRSKMSPEAAFQSLMTFSIRYRMPVFFAGNRWRGQRITESLLVKYHREIEKSFDHKDSLYEIRKAELNGREKQI